MTYRAYGVPMALSSDDQGVSRIDLTHEYLRAVTTYHLSYTNLKELSRNSLEYAFLSGPSLWRSAAPYRVVAQCVDLDAPGCIGVPPHQRQGARPGCPGERLTRISRPRTRGLRHFELPHHVVLDFVTGQ